ncbi:MAG TPA: hypothetical protein VGG72_26600 [Bryobacteraceae bacterium]|jgi:hypothetical protein
MPTSVRAFVAVVAVALPLGLSGQGDTKTEGRRKAAPTFEDFRVPTPIPARKKTSGVANHVADFNREIREVAKDGPNFAGHFVVEAFTCGSLCTEFVVVNVETAEIHFLPFDVSYFCSDYVLGTELVYRLDSRLLIVNGAIETHDSAGREIWGPCGKSYFEWDGHALKQIGGPAIPGAGAPPRPSDVKR